jgi:thiamine-phosphate pyrophosphorylase
VLTDRMRAAAVGHELPMVVRAAARGGADTVVLRDKDLTGEERLAVGRTVVEALVDTATRLVVASDVALAQQLGASGVHLAQGDESIDARDRGELIVGRSCHDRDQVAAARAEGIDYITISPVFFTASKPGYGPALGPDGAVALLADGADVQVAYGLGGIAPDNAAACLRAGLSGIAVMGGVMASADPRRTVTELVAAVTPRAEATR